MAIHLCILQLFPIWRILMGPLPYPALAALHYVARSAAVSYLSLATAAGLVHLGLLFSFQRVAAAREGRVMCAVSAGCLVTTAAHLLLEAACRHHRGLMHIGRWQIYIFLSEGRIDHKSGSGTGFLLLPHLILFILTNLAIGVTKFHDHCTSPGGLLARYRISQVNSGANGRLTCSAYVILAGFFTGVLVISLHRQLAYKLDPADSDNPPTTGLVFFFLLFWLGCGSFLANAEPRQFILRRLSLFWAGWWEDRARTGERAGGSEGRGGGQPAECEGGEAGSDIELQRPAGSKQ